MANNKGDISAVLKRNLKEGKEYDKLIPRVKCERTTLGKGDTFFTVDSMKIWIEKFTFQTKKLAPKLEGRTLEETVNNIYNFLYHHIQYEADGSLQQLRSPACSWMQRYEGIDCKSYSVFASCILSNLGIKHFIRQVRQPYFFPDQFTHVYIVVPKNQNGKNLQNSAMFILDATKHQNAEGNFLEKVDLPMTKLQHIGLNAPQNERTQQLVENFNRFTQHLLQVGVPKMTVNAIIAQVSKFTSQGKDPQFKAVPQGLVIEGQFFPIKLKVDPAYQGGLGIEPVSTMATAGAILELLPADFLNNTFGSIFANGFDLSCWNASYSEAKATQALEIDIPFLLDGYSGFANNPNTTTLNKFLNGIAGYIADSINGQKPKFASCTRKGYALRQKGAEGAREQVLNSLKQAYTLSPSGMVSGSIETNMPSIPGRPYSWSGYQYQAYNLTPKATAATAPSSGNNTTGQLNTDGGSKSNTGLIIGGMALASLPLLFMFKKGSIAANTKAPSKRAVTKKRTK